MPRIGGPKAEVGRTAQGRDGLGRRRLGGSKEKATRWKLGAACLERSLRSNEALRASFESLTARLGGYLSLPDRCAAT
jgi:hypothetical protein